MPEVLHVPDPTEPDVDELQADEMYGALLTPVRVEGPVSTHTLPARGGAARAWTIGDAPERVFGEDPRRKCASLYSHDGPFFFGYSMGEVQASTAAKWPAGVPLHLSNIDELWVRGAPSTTEAQNYGAITTLVGTDPAAGAEWSQTVPVGEEWDLIAVRFTLVTDPTAINRRAAVIIDDGAATGNIIMHIPAVTSQAASLTVGYNYAEFGENQGTVSNQLTESLPRLTLPAGYRIRSLTDAIVPGDNLSAPVFHYIKRTSTALLTVVEENWAH